MGTDGGDKTVLERVAPLLACALVALAVLDLVAGLKGEPLRLAVLIGGAILMLILPKLSKFTIGKDGVSAELIHEAINSAKESTEKSKQLLLQGAGAAGVAPHAAVAMGANPAFDIKAYVAALPTPNDAADPQKGRFGGFEKSGGWQVKADVKDYNEDDGVLSFEVVLISSNKKATDQVYFVLHPSFTPDIYIATMRNGRASIFLRSWGSFTLGVVAEEGKMTLELDLSKLPGAPEPWRER